MKTSSLRRLGRILLTASAIGAFCISLVTHGFTTPPSVLHLPFDSKCALILLLFIWVLRIPSGDLFPWGAAEQIREAVLAGAAVWCGISCNPNVAGLVNRSLIVWLLVPSLLALAVICSTISLTACCVRYVRAIKESSGA
jgi:hypothetical protein